ncbi:hypothetical protein X759_27230 [Mesorhizobium sp. LSHC420B00]|nr:hypothetical protein X759_27230 [Mesorhizobium sp. LSHC420B00]
MQAERQTMRRHVAPPGYAEVVTSDICFARATFSTPLPADLVHKGLEVGIVVVQVFELALIDYQLQIGAEFAFIGQPEKRSNSRDDEVASGTTLNGAPSTMASKSRRFRQYHGRSASVIPSSTFGLSPWQSI